MKTKKLPLIAGTATVKTRIGDKRVKIGLRDGKAADFSEGGQTEEGYSFTHYSFSREGNLIHLSITSNSCDCDGPLDSYQDLVCHVSQLHTSSRKGPEWQPLDSFQRDHCAERMGY